MWYFYCKRLFFGFALIILSGIACADEVDSFIEKVRTVTYDCPVPEDQARLMQLLALPSLTAQQKFDLSTLHSHFLICDGKASQARDLLTDIIEQSDIDKTSYFYASAIYQIGFTYDMAELPERCEYYELAQSLTETQHADVHLSASLGLITNCFNDLEVADRLGMMFSILQDYSAQSDERALAHIHNSIGLIYGELDQHVLAAEQYLKAHEIGLNVYTGSNQLSILISAISSLLASGQFDQAYASILEFEAINQDVATPLTNYYYYHALAGYHYRTGNIAEMQIVLPTLIDAASKISNPIVDAVVDWYTVVPCVKRANKKCIEDYLSKLADQEGELFFADNADYLQLKVEMYMVLDDTNNLQVAFERFASKILEKQQQRQYSASILSVANLYSKIYSLESAVERSEQLKRHLVIAGLISCLFILSVATFFWNRKNKKRLSIDPITHLLNSATALSRISKVDSPDTGKTNALAIFDLGDFRELNRIMGFTKGDLMLKQIAQTLSKVTRDSDILGRLAPEQFILCLPNIEEQIAKTFFERVQTELDSSFTAHHETMPISVRSSMSIFVTTEKLYDLKAILDEMLLSLNLKSKA